MAERIAAFDWAATPLGPVDGWPQSLRTTLSILLGSPFAMCMAWGHDQTFFYNDAYGPILGAKEPAALGSRLDTLWADIWADIRPLYESAMGGEATFSEDMHLVMHRNGYPEDTWWTFSYTPVRDEAGTVAAMLNITTDQTARVLAQRTLTEDRARLGRMFEQAPTFMAMLQGPSHRIEFTNPGYRRLIGDRDVVGRTVAEALPDAVEQGFLDLLDRVYATGEAYAATGARYDVQPEPGGEVFERYCDFVYQPITGDDGRIEGIFVEGVDVTARALADRALREREAQLVALNSDLERQVVERAHERSRTWQVTPDLLGVLNHDGIFEKTNPAWQRLLGWTAEELATRPAWDFVHPDDVEPTLQEMDSLRQGIPLLRFENRYMTRDGGWRWISWVATPEAGKFYCSGRDVTEIHAATEALALSQAQLRQSQKLEAMGQLTGGVAHDFNNLLTPIVIALELAENDAADPVRRRRMVGVAKQSAERAATLVQRLLAFARRQPLQASEVDVARLVAEMADLVETTCDPRIRIETRIPPGVAQAIADANQLEMALLNLSVNARDAMPDGGIMTMGVRNRHVGDDDAHGLRPGHYVVVSVEDTGHGMDETTRVRAIEPFFSTKGVGKGTGLGLSMVHGLASQLGGRLAIDSAPGQGTTIELWLPTGPASAAAHGLQDTGT